MTVGKVKDFNFKSGPVTKNFAMGGSAKAGQSVQMAKSNAVEKTLAGQKMTPMAKGGKVPSAGQGMIKNRGTLGVMNNKNPGETKMHTAPKLPGEKMMMNKGGMAMKKGGMTKKC